MPAPFQPDTAAFTSNLFGDIQANPFLSQRRKNFLSSGVLDEQLAVQDKRFKAQQQAQQLELNNVRLEGDRLALEEARRAAQVKRDAIAQAPAAMQSFESILDDTTLDPKTKRARINRAAMGFASSLIYSPELQARYRFAAQAAEPEIAAEDAMSTYQIRSLRNQELDRLDKDLEKRDKLLKEQKEEKEKLAKAELDFLDRIKDIQIGPEGDIVGNPVVFKNLKDKELALDVIDRYDPATSDAYSGKSDTEIYSAAAEIRRKALRQNFATAAPTAPKVDDKSRFR
jgi:hypothetical protein